jgi:hypothetical protein
MCCYRLNFPVFGGSGRVLPADTILSGYYVPKGVSTKTHISKREMNQSEWF